MKHSSLISGLTGALLLFNVSGVAHAQTQPAGHESSTQSVHSSSRASAVSSHATVTIPHSFEHTLPAVNTSLVHNNALQLHETTHGNVHAAVLDVQELEGDSLDAAFIDMMIVQDQGDIRVARSALFHASHPEILELATMIIESQHDELRALRNARISSRHMRKNEHGKLLRPLHQSLRTTQRTLNTETRDAFDKTFIELMVERYQVTLDLATGSHAQSTDPVVTALARGIISSRQQGIDQLQQWYADWGYDS